MFAFSTHDLKPWRNANEGVHYRWIEVRNCACDDAPRLAVGALGCDGKNRSLHVPYVLADDVRAGVDAWHRFLAIARELGDRNRAQVWDRARRQGDIR